MGHKVHPTGIRLGISKDWNSTWYSGKKDFAAYLAADLKVREMLREKLAAEHGGDWQQLNKLVSDEQDEDANLQSLLAWKGMQRKGLRPQKIFVNCLMSLEKRK